MKSVISARDIEELISKGGNPASLPADAIITPSARELLHDWQNGNHRNGTPTQASTAPAQPSKPLSSKSPKAELDAFFSSPQAHDLKLQICEVGRRLWQRAY